MAYWLSAVFDSSFFLFLYNRNRNSKNTWEGKKEGPKEGGGRERGGSQIAVNLIHLLPCLPPRIYQPFIAICKSFVFYLPPPHHFITVPRPSITISNSFVFHLLHHNLPSSHAFSSNEPLIPHLPTPNTLSTTLVSLLFISRRSNDATAGRDHPV